MPETPAFDPDAFQVLRCTRWSYDDASHTATFEYALDDDIHLREVYVFPTPPMAWTTSRRDAFERVLAHLHVAAGVSYYKLAAPKTVRIECGTWTDADITFHRLLVARGLGEYAWRNGLEAELSPAFEYRASGPTAPVRGLGLDRGPLVPVGGGKDSCVTIEALRKSGRQPTLLTVNRYPVIQDVIDASALPDLAVRRILDPQMRDLNARGARNGHVPVTAIVSLTAIAAAILHGHDAVVMSNERSASEGNVAYRGVEINHQWSKSSEAEAMLVALLASITPELAYGSLLRPCSELAIVRRFAETCGRYVDAFSSCNAAFRLDPDRRVSRWCGHCPKCQFVHLALATALDRPTIARVFGGDVFASSPIDGFRALLGLTAWKPFECVGESLECRVALRLVLEKEEWAAHPVLSSLRADVMAAGQWPTDRDIDAVFADDGELTPRLRALLAPVSQ